MNWLGRRVNRIALGVLKRTGPTGTGIYDTWADAWRLMMGDPGPAVKDAFAEAVWFYACVRAKMEFLSQVPFVLFRVPKGKLLTEKEPLPWDHAANAVYRRPNPQTVQAKLLEARIAFLEIAGNAYLYKGVKGQEEGDPYGGQPAELWVLDPNQVTIDRDAKGIVTGYHYGGTQRPRIDPKRIIHYSTFNPHDDLVGQSTIKPLTRIIATDLLAQEYDEQFLKNGARPPGWLFTEQVLSDPVRERLLEGFRKTYGGVKNAGKPALFEGGVKYQQGALSQKDMEMPGLRTYDRESIMAATRVTPVILGLPTANYALGKEERRIFIEDAGMPLLNKIAQYDNAFLLPDFGPDIFGEYDYSAVPAMKDDEEQKERIAVALVGNRIISPNEARHDYYKKLPYEGGDAIKIPAMMADAGEVKPERSRASKNASTGARHSPAQTLRLESYHRKRDSLDKQAHAWWIASFDKQEARTLESLAFPRSAREQGDIFDAEFLEEATAATVTQVMAAAVAAGLVHAQEPLDWLDLSKFFDINNPKLHEWLRAFSASEVRLVKDTTETMLRDRIRQVLADGVAAGKTESEIAKDLRAGVSEIFEDRRRNAMTIVQTEVQHGVQETQRMAWRESGVVEEKQWLASMMANGRHNEMNGQTVGIDEEFVHPGGDFCDAGTTFDCPGGSGQADQDINCLCDMAPVVSAKAKSDYLVRDLMDAVYPVRGKGSRAWKTRENLRTLAR